MSSIYGCAMAAIIKAPERGNVVCITNSTSGSKKWPLYPAYCVHSCNLKGSYICDGVLDTNDTAALIGIFADSPGLWTAFNPTATRKGLTSYGGRNAEANTQPWPNGP